ncbi:MAG: tetratricopeptide repeat protein [Myxococcales bacterium]|nr:tetratricopeptide repeat protein [Myxococcales bacterium]
MTANTTLERSIEALKVGHPEEALKIAAEAIAAAVREHGAGSPQQARALFDQAHIFVFLGELDAALDAVTHAASIAATDDPSRRAQLDFQKARGDLLLKMGRFDEARAVFEQNIDGRRAFYGEESVGLAHGQFALAELLLQRGDAEAAEPLVELIAGSLWHARDELLAPSLSLRALVLAARYGDERPMFEHFDLLSREQQQLLLQSLLQMAQNAPPEAAFLALQELRERLEEFDSPDVTKKGITPFLEALCAIVELQHGVAAHLKDEARIGETLDWLARHYGQRHAIPQLLTVQMRQARFKAAQGSLDAARADFRAIAERLIDGESIGDDSALALPLLCEIAMFFASQADLEQADALLQKACALAEKQKDPRHLGNTCAAYGLFLQHHDRGVEAWSWLERAHDLLQNEGFAALQLRLHLSALLMGTPCGCTPQTDALTSELERRVRALLPQGLLGALRIHPIKGIELSLSKPPNDEEKQHLQRAILEAIDQIKAVRIDKARA